MTKGEIETIRNIIARLKEPNIGHTISTAEQEHCTDEGAGKGKSNGRTYATRIYVDTWLIGPLELLIGEGRNVELARSMSRK
ncbi:hypothetical protein EVB39_124 [Rhizobium phage RHph_TM3_3_9]|nr:hypothetical protein EVB39_124 [Rhizobium phage RHph_TM3_3_9]QIG68645.1 hypothetical protein EVB66_124 [Rhizobium phage RHph_TM3_3_13]QIG74503.1 hypothetical protein EVC09_123 [Rhizobium phage RHph_TM3_3_10]QXV74617.1 hypothetical protein [Rhizobium phage RHEph19]